MAEKKSKDKNQYSSAEDYKRLEEIEHVREYPGNYIGSTDERGWHHLAQEVIDNSIDEAVAGRCDQIKVTLSPDQRTITIEDNGNGFPMENLEETNQSVLFSICSFLRSGGKFTKKIYKTSGGLHGIGLTAVNFLSQELKLWNRREGKTQILEFNRGILKKEEFIESPQAIDGLTVTFTPDPKVFQEFTYFKIETIQSRLRDLAYLNPNVTLTFLSSPEATPVTYHYSSGLAGWVKEINQDNYLENTEICLEEWTDLAPIRKDEEGSWIKEHFYLNFAWQYSQEGKPQLKSFCNNIRTEGGGSHLTGFENGLVGAIRDWIKEKNPELKVSIKSDDILEGLVAVVAIRMGHPQFFGQTKYSLAMNPVREVVKNATYDLVKKFLQDHGGSAETISQKVIETAQNRAKTEEYQQTLREGGRGVSLPGKLVPCMSKEVAENELFIVEGDSAGGSAKAARFPKNQAILPVQGKILNVLKAKWSQISKNKEVISIMNALGFSATEAAQNYYNFFRNELDHDIIHKELEIPEEFIYQDENGQEQIIPAHTSLTREQVEIIIEKSREKLLKKIRYGKIILMADADPDGEHIECLGLNFFIRYFRYLIEDGRLNLAVTPLYRWQTKEGVRYFANDYLWEEYRQENKKVTGSLQRFKGLGEMNAKQLRDIVMIAEKRSLNELTYLDPLAIRKVVQDLMGSKSEPRKKLLESGEYKHAELKAIGGKVDIKEALLVKFSDYGYEVVEERALAQLQDGLKPVQRYILYVLYLLGYLPNKPHKKVPGVIGDVIKYHPHGDQSIYQAMVKMAQDFNYRYPLVDGQGNWGSIDGDSAAAFRYTEARLTRFGWYLLKDLEYETVVNWVVNDYSNEKEPEVLPPHLNLLLNGSSGIAVGMSANLPPHNLGEVVDLTIELLNNPQLNTEELIINWECSNCQSKGKGKTIQCSACQSTNLKLNYFGPDFPTGGQVLERERLLEIYEKGECPKGKGTIYIRAKTEIISSEQKKEKKDLIRITELPFKVNKSKLVVSINQIIKEKRIPGLKSVDDYSNFEDPVNIHCYFDPNYDGEVILNQLYKRTKLQNTFSVQMRALIGDQPRVFSLKETLQGFIDKKLEIIKKKSQFIYHKTQKELINLKIRFFNIKNYERIVQVVNDSSSKEESKKKFLDKFQEEIKDLVDATVDLFLADLIIKAEKAISEIQSQNRRRTEAGKREKYRELVGLMRQIEVYKNSKGYQNKESEINEIKESINSPDIKKRKSDQEFPDTPKLLEDYLNPEQKVAENILGNPPPSFFHFFLEQKKKLQSDIEALKEKLTQQRLLITNQEQRKQQLINELVELKKDYANDHRRTVITSQLHLIAERQLIPHEKRIILLSRSESKKENKFNNYLTVHNLAAVEPTNIPSVGRELKTRGDNWAVIKLDRRDDLWCFSNYGKLYELSFYKFAALNKTTNLNEEYFMRMKKGELKPTLQAQEFFTAVLPVPEEFTQEKFLLIITKKGKIKLWGTEKLQNISKSGKKLTNFYQKTIEKCSPHQSQLTEHKAVAHACGIGCSQRRELQKQIKECSNCQEKWTGSGDEIAKSALIQGNEEIELIIKRKSKDGVVKNLKVPVYRQVRKKDEEGNLEYCSGHKVKLKKHKTANCCDKSQGVKAYSRCAKFRKLRNEIKGCGDCQNPELFKRQERKQVKCEKVVDLLIIKERENKENLLLLLIKKDNNCEKRPLATAKTWISTDSKLKKTDYCQKHWQELEKLEKSQEKTESEWSQEKEIMEERILKSTLPLETKKKTLKDIIITGIDTKEMERKIANSPVDLTASEAAIENLTEDLKQKGKICQKLLAEVKKQQEKINDFKEKSKQCKSCQKYCSPHEKKTQKVMSEHETCKHCQKYDKQIQQSRAKVVELKEKLENLKKIKPGATKEIQKLTNELVKKKEQGEKIRHESFGNRTKCPILNELKTERKDCLKCQEQKQKKYRAQVENPLQRVCLFNKNDSPEIYLLSREAVCWYNKKDLSTFLTGEGKTKSLLKAKERGITDIKFYTF